MCVYEHRCIYTYIFMYIYIYIPQHTNTYIITIYIIKLPLNICNIFWVLNQSTVNTNIKYITIYSLLQTYIQKQTCFFFSHFSFTPFYIHFKIHFMRVTSKYSSTHLILYLANIVKQRSI